MNNTLLIADDDAYCADVFEKFLKKLGCRVLRCGNAAEAVDAINSGGISLCVADYHIPLGGAGAVISGARSRGAETRFIIMTGDASPEAERAARSFSPDFFFVKPISLEDFGAVVEKILRKAGEK